MAPAPASLQLSNTRERGRKASTTIREIREEKKYQIRNRNTEDNSNTGQKGPQHLHLARPTQGLTSKEDAAVLL